MQITLHAVFSGNPGTGKTTFARFYAQQIKKLGLLKTAQLIEVTRQDLVAEFIGQTASKTAAVVKKAFGGILFIDEAYSLKNAKEDSFGQECIDTLIKLIEDHRDDLILILAGYTDEMREFLHLNPGLKSRIQHLLKTSPTSSANLRRLCKKAGFWFTGGPQVRWNVAPRRDSRSAMREVKIFMSGPQAKRPGWAVEKSINSAKRIMYPYLLDSPKIEDSPQPFPEKKALPPCPPWAV